MRVAFDAGPLLDPPTGVGRYTRELALALERIGVEVKRFAIAYGGDPPPNVARLRMPARLAQWTSSSLGRPRVTKLTGPVDVVHGTNFVLPSARVPGVVTIHDLSYLKEGAFLGAARLVRLVPWSLQRAERVVVPTQSIADEVGAEYGVPGEKLVVTHEGVAPVFFGAAPLSDSALAAMGIARPFVLATGTDAPRKNLQRLLDAWQAASRAALKGWTLVLAGPPGWGPRFGRTGDIHPLGWVGDETLPGLMAAAEAFCYPSLYEGFGLPPLEAMASGTACLVGGYPAAREVVGDAALIVDPTDTDSIGDGLLRLVGDESLRRLLAQKGKARAAGYTWEGAATSTLRAYRAAASQPK